MERHLASRRPDHLDLAVEEADQALGVEEEIQEITG